MSQRIGGRDLAGAAEGQKTSATRARFGAALASPLGILLIVPGLVVALGLVLTALGQNAIRESSLESGRARFAEQTDSIVRSVGVALAAADAVLDRMTELVRARSAADPTPPFAHALRGLIRGRPGLSYVSV